jgi:hypothetical protein
MFANTLVCTLALQRTACAVTRRLSVCPSCGGQTEMEINLCHTHSNAQGAERQLIAPGHYLATVQSDVRVATNTKICCQARTLPRLVSGAVQPPK